MKRYIRPVISWVLVLLWMFLIFSMSAQKSAESNKNSIGVSRMIASVFVRGWDGMTEAEQAEVVGSIHVFVRKTAHFTLYAVLGMLSFNAVSCHTKNRRLSAVLALAISVLYSVSDEIHQLFTAGRSCEIRDVLIDSSGAIPGILIMWAVYSLISRKKAGSDKQNKT